jgi:hypothetical protein
MLTVARTAVPIAVAGLLLTGCSSGGKDRPAPLDPGPMGANAIGAPEPMGAGSGGKPMGSAGSDAAASMGGASQRGIALPVAAAAPVSAPATMNGHTITTRGVGKVSGTPDTFTIVIGVSTQGSSAKAALTANNAKSTALLDLLRAKGIATKDLQTRQLSVNPTYDDKSATITGYQVDNMVQASSRDIAGAGALIDAAAGVVGNAVRVQHISFSVGDDNALRAQARDQAVNLAKAQAAQLAKAAGVTLGRIRSITEMVDPGHSIGYDMRSAAGAAESAPLQAGQQELTISVDIVYDIS